MALISLLTPSQLHGDTGLATKFINPLESLSVTSSIGQIKSAISYIAIQYGIEPSGLVGVVKCESSFVVTAKNPNSSASGLAQYLNSTWDNVCVKKYGFNDKKDPVQQLICLGKMWSSGGQSNWDESKYCWSKYFSS